MTKVIFRQDLMKTFESVRQNFDQALQDAKMQEQEFERACRTFQTNMAKHIHASRDKMSAKNPMVQSLDAIKVALEKTNQKWDQDIKNRDKGVGFRAKFNDSLLVFIYGKVKSGKSSLGNYMAWGNTDPTDVLKSNVPVELHPVYFSEERTDVKSGDAHKEAEKNKQFRVGATEATSSIQGFQLSGLTWVDSPGLHSINEANGDLARQYVEHSDLVLYTMKSDSPGRESDIREILDLYRADKKILLLITGSDDTEEDWDDEKDEMIQKIVMKDEERREKQVAQVRQALEKLPKLAGKSGNIEIISFSARYAQLHEEQAQEFNDSGMGQLFAKLQQVASEEGVKLKQQVPMRNFSNFMQDFAKDMVEYKKALTAFQEPIADIQKKMPITINAEMCNIQRNMDRLIDEKFDAISEDHQQDVELMRQILREINKQLGDAYRMQLETAQVNIIQEVLSDIENEMLVGIEDSDYLEMPDFDQRTRISERAKDMKAGNKGKYAAVGSAVGGAAGTLLGGPIGGMIGGVVGGLVGNALGSDDEIITEQVETVIGNNLASIKNQCRQNIQKLSKAHLDEFKQKLIDSAIDNFTQLNQNIMQEVDSFEKSLQGIQSNINNHLK